MSQELPLNISASHRKTRFPRHLEEISSWLPCSYILLLQPTSYPALLPTSTLNPSRSESQSTGRHSLEKSNTWGSGNTEGCFLRRYYITNTYINDMELPNNVIVSPALTKCPGSSGDIQHSRTEEMQEEVKISVPAGLMRYRSTSSSPELSPVNQSLDLQATR